MNNNNPLNNLLFESREEIEDVLMHEVARIAQEKLERLETICKTIAHHGADYNRWRQTPEGKKALPYVEACKQLKQYFKE